MSDEGKLILRYLEAIAKKTLESHPELLDRRVTFRDLVHLMKDIVALGKPQE